MQADCGQSEHPRGKDGVRTPQPVVVEEEVSKYVSQKKSGSTPDGKKVEEAHGNWVSRQPFWTRFLVFVSFQNWLFFYFSLGGWEVGRVREWVDGVSEAFGALTATFPF